MSPRRLWLPMLSALALLLTPFALAPRGIVAQGESVTYTVTTTSDAFSGNCNATPTSCSLRQAINSASADGTTSLIQFSLDPGIQVITLTSTLPAIAGSGDRVSGAVDGFGRPRVVIDGGGSLRYGFQITGANNTIERLIFSNFSSGAAPNGVAIWITGAGATGNKIFGNYIGVRPAETTARANYRGVQIDNGASGNFIGGNYDEPTQRNIIAGNSLSGIYIEGASGNFLRGNFIGVTLDGSGAVTALGNGGPGVEISNSAGNDVGGTFAQRNLIADNALAGVRISGATATGNEVLSNYIGTNDFASASLGTQDRGVLIEDGAKNNSLLGTSTAQLVISGNTGFGVVMRGEGTTGNTVSGAYIGTNAASIAAVANSGGGVRIEDEANRNTIGPGAVIAGNAGDGISIGLTLPTSTEVVSTVVRASFIGLGNAGSVALPNTGRGVVVGNGSRETVIGGNASSDANYIAANGGVAVDISGTSTALVTVRNNVIGLRRTSPSGNYTVRAANTGEGILVSGGAKQVTITSNTVAGSADTTATDFPAIRVTGDGTVGPEGTLSATNVATVTIVANRIGWLPSGSSLLAFPNADGVAVSGRVRALSITTNTIQLNLGAGIRVTDAFTGTVVRGNNPVFRNAEAGIIITGNSSSVTVERNTVRESGLTGTGTPGTPTGTPAPGVLISGATLGANVISNTLRANTGQAIRLEGPVSRVTMRYNRLAQNGGPIELVGATTYPGSGPDPDSFTTPNHGIDGPIVDPTFANPLALRINQSGFIEGFVLTSTNTLENQISPVSACVTCTIQIFRPDPALSTPDGQGWDLLRTIPEGSSSARDSVPVAASGRFSTRLQDPLPPQLLFIATDGFGNSSEYSVLPIVGSLVLEPISPLSSSQPPGATVTYTLRLRNTGTVNFTNLRLATSGTLARWAVNTVPVSNTDNIELAAGAALTVSVGLTLPTGSDPNVLAGTVDRTTLTISGGPPQTSVAQQLVTTVLARPVIVVTPRSSLGSGRPTESVPHRHTIRNNGNVTVTLGLQYRTIDPASSPGIWSTSLSVNSLTLGPGREGDLLVSVTVPQGAQQTDGLGNPVQATTLLTGTIPADTTAGYPAQTIPFSDTTRVSLSPNADLYPDQQVDGRAGAEVRFTNFVENKSNGRATFCLDSVAFNQSSVRFESATEGFTMSAQGCFTLDTVTDPDNERFSVAQFTTIVQVSEELLRGDVETIRIFLRRDTPAGETLGDTSVENRVNITGGPVRPYLWLPLMRK